MSSTRTRLAAAAALASALVVAGGLATPAAHAAITSSKITTPANPSFFIADQDANTQTFAISGTTTGQNGTTDAVDVNCYWDGSVVTVAHNVPLSPTGSFSIPKANLDQPLDLTCRLRAVPAGTKPSDLTPFAGPVIGVGERGSEPVADGPNTGKVVGYYIDAQQKTAAFDYNALGGCGLTDGYLYDSTFAQTTTTFSCDAALFSSNSVTAPTRSELQIDGANAYDPFSAGQIDPNATGLPSLTDTYTVDEATGNVVIHETDPLVECREATYPPNVISCSSFDSAGVTDDRTVAQSHDGHISSIRDSFKSTDGKTHSLDLLWDDSQHFWGASGDSTQLEYEFPGQTGFSTHAAGDSVSLPSSGGTIFVRMHGAADGDTGTGQGAIVYNRPASAATFTLVQSFQSELTLHQTGTVPAGGSTTFRSAYVQDFSAAGVASLAKAAAKTFLNTILVTKSGSGKGKVTSSPGGIACGNDLQPQLRRRNAGDPEGEARQGLEVRGLVGRLQGQAQLHGHTRRQRGRQGEVRPALTRASRQSGNAASRESIAMQVERRQNGRMATCRACGQENPEIARFCLACGAPLETTDAPHREERRIVSVVFVDLVGFTSRSERLDPEDVRAILTPYHATVRDELASFGGVVEKFVGDAVMAVFGAPIAHGDDPERAVRAALAVREAVVTLNREQPELELRIRGAVNTGEAVVTLSARPALGEAMVAGDVVNTASRLQQHAPVGEIVVGEETYRATRAAIEYEPSESVSAEGKSAPIDAWRAVTPSSAVGERDLSSTPFVGRTREARLLDATWERVELERRPHLVTVLGPPGVGKSRLAAEFTESHRVARRSGRPRPLPPLSRAQRVRRVCDAGEGSRGHLRQRRRRRGRGQAARLRDAAGRAGAGRDCRRPPRDPARLRDPRDDARPQQPLPVGSRLHRGRGARPGDGLVFEDIHWADPALLDLIELLAARLHDLPVLLLTLARPELLDVGPPGAAACSPTSAPPRAARHRGRRQLALHLLGARATAARVRGEPAEGNPLFIEQLAAVMIERRPGSVGHAADDDPRPRGGSPRRAPLRGARRHPRRLDRRPALLARRARATRTRPARCSERARRARAARPDPPRSGVADRGR